MYERNVTGSQKTFIYSWYAPMFLLQRIQTVAVSTSVRIERVKGLKFSINVISIDAHKKSMAFPVLFSLTLIKAEQHYVQICHTSFTLNGQEMQKVQTKVRLCP
jgi:hypothetical protein